MADKSLSQLREEWTDTLTAYNCPRVPFPRTVPVRLANRALSAAEELIRAQQRMIDQLTEKENA